MARGTAKQSGRSIGTRGGALDQSVPAEGLVDAVLIGARGHLVGGVFDGLRSASHRDPDPCVSEHLEVIGPVTDRDGVFAVEAEVCGDQHNAGCLVDPG
jgi:hypothetical protein